MMKTVSFSKTEIEEIVVWTRLFLYNRDKPCGAKAIRKEMDYESIRPLPSLSTITRILSRRHLTHRRTGHYR
ncbi:MAG: hypothetical protein ABFC95_03815 [Smithella sp.]|jgi:hypothetical protein